MLTNVTLYWLTGTAGSSAQIYYENMHSMSCAPPERSPVHTAVANFTQDVAIRRFGGAGSVLSRFRACIASPVIAKLAQDPSAENPTEAGKASEDHGVLMCLEGLTA
jgi:hypothetical protein